MPHVVLNYGYDAVGNETSVVDNAGVRVDSQYNSRDLVTQETWQGGGIASGRVDMSYDNAGQRVGLDQFSDLAGTQVVAKTVENHDPVSRLMQRTTTAANGTGIVDYRYSFDKAGQVTSESHHGQTANYSYDLAGQVLGAVKTGQPNEAYAYDAAGNHTGNGQTVDTSNRVTSDDRFNYAYDNEGNLTAKTESTTGDVTTFTYDYRNRLTEAIRKSSGGIILSDAKYIYDVFDRVIARDVNGQRLVTVYNGMNPWADYNGSGAVAARYLYGNRADEILARWRPTDGQAWYLADKQGSIRDIVNASGAVIGHLDYDGFGKILTSAGAVDRFAFQGREWEAAVGQYQFRARFYDPDLRQFSSEDPLGFGGGDANLRRFVGNNPLTLTDPSGKTDMSEEAAIHAGISAALRAYGHCMLQSAMISSAISLAVGTYLSIQDLKVNAVLCVVPSVFAGLTKYDALLGGRAAAWRERMGRVFNLPFDRPLQGKTLKEMVDLQKRGMITKDQLKGELAARQADKARQSTAAPANPSPAPQQPAAPTPRPAESPAAPTPAEPIPPRRVPASEDQTVAVRKQIDRDISKQAGREFHDAKEGGTGDRTIEEVREDALDIYRQHNKKPPSWIENLGD